MINWKDKLNPPQLEAVTTINGPVLVIAGAGSGKTRVIEYRVLYLVEQGISPSSILLLTFTRRAAHEMLSRAGRNNIKCKDVEGGTFHSFAYKILRKYSHLFGFSSNFSVIDESDAEDIIAKCCAKLGYLEKEKRFPKKETLRSIISQSVNKCMSIEDVLMREYPALIEYADDIITLSKKYAEYKVKSNYMDYDDLLLYLVRLLEKNDIRNSLSQKYKYIMVDEYQDTNKLQGNISYYLAESHRNIMAVGDDAQSIYGFRGACHLNIMEFPQRFPEVKIIKLEKNYRSTQSILDVGNAVLENMKNKYHKCLFSTKNGGNEKPYILFFKDAYDEANWIASKIQEFYNKDIPLSSQSVLFRASYISIPLQAELTKRNIPYRVFGGLKFYETAHVKDILSYLRIVQNPKDELAWTRVLMQIEGIGHKTSEDIFEEILAYSNLVEIQDKIIKKWENINGRYSKGLAKLNSLLKKISSGNASVGELFEIVLDYYIPILKDKFSDDWDLRLNDLETLKQISARYTSLHQFLTDLAIEPPERGVSSAEPTSPYDTGPLTLSTIHAAKGLEWDCVFLIGLIEGVLPSYFALGYEDKIEEEHRLLYVGITRAKKHLFLTLHHEGSRGGMYQLNRLSRFICKENVLEKLEKNFIPVNTKDTFYKEEDCDY